MPIDVYIYASHPGSHGKFEASWHARYVRHIDGDMGAHPDKRCRPKAAETDTNDSEIFWEVEALREIEAPIPLTSLQGYHKDKKYSPAFFPHGPVLIEHP